jgi:hypothetical protein
VISKFIVVQKEVNELVPLEVIDKPLLVRSITFPGSQAAEGKVLLPKKKMTIVVFDVEFYLILLGLTESIEQILMGVFFGQDHPCTLTHGCFLGKPLATTPHLKAALNLHLGGGVFGRKNAFGGDGLLDGKSCSLCGWVRLC